MKNSNDTIGNRNRKASSVVPKPPALSRVSGHCYFGQNLSHVFSPFHVLLADRFGQLSIVFPISVYLIYCFPRNQHV